ncbi:metalloprotease [Tautonia rosea]|uniref:metalloprotease n=1 Tax=Tautonia rosea TaxID=2728037 RepID=UPI001472F58F|nr:site-2 protease family protein [Tautonia rosea]
MFGIPSPTRFDLNFRLFGIPIRVSPFFWLIAAIIGMRFGGETAPENTLIIAACVFLSVLVHELGHGLTAKLGGEQPWIVLHGFGGVCASDREQRGFGARLLVTLMGPVAGFLLAIAAVILWAILVTSGVSLGPEAELALSTLLLLNILYSVFNLIPIWPLDGGQLMMTLFDRVSPRNGARRAHIVSFLAAGTGAALAAIWAQWLILTLLLGYLAFTNYVLLSHHHRMIMAEREG